MLAVLEFESYYYNRRSGGSGDIVNVKIEEGKMTFRIEHRICTWHEEPPIRAESGPVLSSDYDNKHWWQESEYGGLFTWLENDGFMYPAGLGDVFEKLYERWRDGELDALEGKRIMDAIFQLIEVMDRTDQAREIRAFRNS